MNVVNNLEFDWNKIMEAAAGFLKNGAGSVLDLPLIRQKILLVQWERFLLHLYSQFIFCCRKEKWEDRRKSIICVCQEEVEQKLCWKSFSDVQDIF